VKKKKEEEIEKKIMEVMVIQVDRHASIQTDRGFGGSGGGEGTFQRSCREDQTNEVTRIKKKERER